VIIDRTAKAMKFFEGWTNEELEIFADIFVQKFKTNAGDFADTGNLRSTIGRDRDAEGLYVATGVDENCGYGVYNELGTSRNPTPRGRGKMAQSFEEAKKDFNPKGR